MKKLFVLSFTGLLIAGCSSYTSEQGEAAAFMCDCMTNGIEGEETDDRDILYFMCNENVEAKFDKTVFSDEGYTKALFEKCPDQELVSEE